MRIFIGNGNKMSIKKKLIITLIVLILLFVEIFFLNKFFEKNTLIFQSPVEIKFNKPISIEKRETTRQVNITIIYEGEKDEIDFEE